VRIMENELAEKWKQLSLTKAKEDKLVYENEPDEVMDELGNQNNIFVFQFSAKANKEKVLDQGPWSFDKKLLLLKEVVAGEHPAEMVFNAVRFWVKVYQLPVDKRKKSMAAAMTNKMGKFVDLDPSKPLLRGMKVLVGKAKNVWIFDTKNCLNYAICVHYLDML
ncbi:Polyribonucleotide nucleotidyltransferase, partial [Bienertia sinuspersici]